MTLVLLYELITWFGRIFLPKIDRTQRLLDMVKDRTISSRRTLTATDSNSKTLHPTINRSRIWGFCAQQYWTYLNELLLCQSHS
jgi:hypothetical protein